MTGKAPPGRAGRTWLAARIEVATRAVELLEQKQQLLRRERRRLAEVSRRTGEEWSELATDADRGNLRALVSGGRDELRRAEAAIGAAQARVTWTTLAGAPYPSATGVDLGPPPAVAGPPALVEAVTACRRALDAAVRQAAAAAALRRVESELVVTVRRLRAVRDRWIPRLEAELMQLELRLDDGEREEATRLRWAGGPAPGSRE